MKTLINSCLFIFTISFGLISCKSVPVATITKPTPGLLFPDGVYKQDVSVKIDVPEKNLKDNFDFNAAIKKQNHQLIMLAYNSFGVSLFRIEDNPNLPLQWTSEIEMVNKNKDFFLNLYPQIKKIFSLRGEELKLDRQIYFWQEGKIKIEFIEFDQKGFPIQMAMSDQKHYWVKIINKN